MATDAPNQVPSEERTPAPLEESAGHGFYDEEDEADFDDEDDDI
jgi:hypothetical protein